MYTSTSVFLISLHMYMAHHWPKELLIWRCTVLYFGQWCSYVIMIILSVTALTLCYSAQDVFSMAHTLTIVEPIWPMLQNLSKTLKYMRMY